MAASNWDTLATEFTIIERRLRDDELTDAMHARRHELDAYIERACANDAIQEALDDPHYHELSDIESEGRTIRTALLSASDGSFVHEPSDWEVRIRKNWVYAGSQSRWQPNGGFVDGTLMEIQDADMRFGALRLLARRGPQQGVYMCAYTTDYTKVDDTPIVIHRGMVGCGVYGFEGEDFVGVTADSFEFLKTIDEFPPFLNCLPWNEVGRFNQGDQFFAREFGIDTPTSAVGDVTDPMIMDAIRGLQRSDDD